MCDEMMMMMMKEMKRHDNELVKVQVTVGERWVQVGDAQGGAGGWGMRGESRVILGECREGGGASWDWVLFDRSCFCSQSLAL